MNPYTINPPQSEVAFEKLCLALLKRHWNRPGLELFGKKGEDQYGVDIFDTLGEDPIFAAQCKLKEQTKSLTPGEIKEEVEKAKTFPSRIDHYVILTTGKASGHAQLTIQSLNQECRASGLFTVQFLNWDQITEMIRQYPDIEAQFYGGFRSEEVAVVNNKLDQIVDIGQTISATFGATGIDAEIDIARDLINSRDAQIALSQLNRIQKTRGSDLTEWHRFRIFTNLGAACLILQRGTEAARHFLDAAPLRRTDELAVANEVLAFHLLGDDEQTRQKVVVARETFPHSTRLMSLWIQSSPIDMPYEDLLVATPVHLRSDAEVSFALGMRAMACDRIEAGEQHAQDAVAAKPKWSQAHLFLAQVRFGRVVLLDRSGTPLYGPDRLAALQNADLTASKAIEVAEAEGISYVKAKAFGLKSDIATILGNKEDAIRYARDSFGADSSDIDAQISLAQALMANGNRDDAIIFFEEIHARFKEMPNVNFMLGEALLDRGAATDLSRAFDVFSSATVGKMKQELVDPITIGAVRALALAERHSEVASYAERQEVIASPVLATTIRASASMKQGTIGEANQLLDDAIALRTGTTTLSATDVLARNLMELGRWADALPLLQFLFSRVGVRCDPNLLLNCAVRLRRDDVVLETFDSLYAKGFRMWDNLEYELQYLERYDYEKAIARLQDFIAANPEHRLAELRLAIVALRFGRKDLARISVAAMPLAEEIPMRYAVPAIHVLQWGDQAMEAVDYAYRVLRANPNKIEAHTAYIAALAPGACPDEIGPATETVQIGSAVQYSRGNNGVTEWLVVEDTETPSSDFEEISATSELAVDLIGKRVGDTFVRVKSPLRDHIGTIVQIMPKYTRRIQAIGPQMEYKFSDQSVIWTLEIPTPEKLTLADVQPILDSVRSQSEAVLQVREIYRTSTITLHMFGDRFNNSAHGALIDLACSGEDFVKCAPPDVNSLMNAMSALAVKNIVVIDLTALATLRLLDITRQVLSVGTIQFVISAATYATLQQLRAKAKFSPAHGTMFYKDGQHYMVPTTEQEAEQYHLAFEQWLMEIEVNAKIVTVPEVARLLPDTRDQLNEILGEEGLESAMLALRPGHLLWSDDYNASELAKTELGVERVWTQALTEQVANLGLIDRSLAEEIYAKLIGYDFKSTHFTGSVMLAALRLARYSVDNFPMAKMLKAFAGVPIFDRRVSFFLMGEFLLKMALEPLLPETRCEATKALLSTYPNDDITNTQLDIFAKQCARSMILTPQAADDFLRCYNGWRKQRRSRIPIIGV